MQFALVDAQEALPRNLPARVVKLRKKALTLQAPDPQRRALARGSRRQVRVGMISMGSTTNHYAALSQAEFDTLLAWLAPGRDEAGERYEAARRMLTRVLRQAPLPAS